MPRYAQPLPLEAVQQRLFHHLSCHDTEANGDALSNGFDWDAFMDTVPFGEGFQRVFAADLSKVAFDLENIGVVKAPNGPFVLVNGVPMLFAWAGGDWEWPVHFVLYIDPKNQVRGYVPKDGNRYNRSTRKAYGNDDDVDVQDLQKHFGTNDWNYKTTAAEYAAMLADVAQRVQPKLGC